MNNEEQTPAIYQQTDEVQPLLRDLPVNVAQSNAVKGGPVEIKELTIKVTVPPPPPNP